MVSTKEIYLVWHDNGKSGQYGYTEEEIDRPEEALRKSYEDYGIKVYSIERVRV